MFPVPDSKRIKFSDASEFQPVDSHVQLGVDTFLSSGSSSFTITWPCPVNVGGGYNTYGNFNQRVAQRSAVFTFSTSSIASIRIDLPGLNGGVAKSVEYNLTTEDDVITCNESGYYGDPFSYVPSDGAFALTAPAFVPRTSPVSDASLDMLVPGYPGLTFRQLAAHDFVFIYAGSPLYTIVRSVSDVPKHLTYYCPSFDVWYWNAETEAVGVQALCNYEDHHPSGDNSLPDPPHGKVVTYVPCPYSWRVENDASNFKTLVIRVVESSDVWWRPEEHPRFDWRKIFQVVCDVVKLALEFFAVYELPDGSSVRVMEESSAGLSIRRPFLKAKQVAVFKPASATRSSPFWDIVD